MVRLARHHLLETHDRRGGAPSKHLRAHQVELALRHARAQSNDFS
jgi:hypothetical protein